MKKKWIIIALLPLPLAIVYFIYKYFTDKDKDKKDDGDDNGKEVELTTTESRLNKLNSCPRDAEGYPTGCSELLASLTDEAAKMGKRIIILDGKYIIE